MWLPNVQQNTMHRIGKVCIAMNTSNKILIIKSCRKNFTCNDAHDILETSDTHLRSVVRVSCTFDLFHTNIGRSLGDAAHHVAKKCFHFYILGSGEDGYNQKLSTYYQRLYIFRQIRTRFMLHIHMYLYKIVIFPVMKISITYVLIKIFFLTTIESA